MALDREEGRRALQLITSRYDDKQWRKKIEKTLSLPPHGFGDDKQRQIFVYLKLGLKAYKSRRADPDSWIVGGYATKEVIDRARFKPSVVGSALTDDDVSSLGLDPGEEVDEAWWDDMLVKWFEEPEPEDTASEHGENAPQARSEELEVPGTDSKPEASPDQDTIRKRSVSS